MKAMHNLLTSSPFLRSNCDPNLIRRASFQRTFLDLLTIEMLDCWKIASTAVLAPKKRISCCPIHHWPKVLICHIPRFTRSLARRKHGFWQENKQKSFVDAIYDPNYLKASQKGNGGNSIR